MGRKKLDSSLDSKESLRRAQLRYEQTEKGKARKKRYFAQPEIKEREKERSTQQYAHRYATDPLFAEREKERLRQYRLRKKLKQLEQN